MAREENDEVSADRKQHGILAESGNLPRTALILYGSETGNAQDVAEEVGRMTERLHFQTAVIELDSITLRDLLKPLVVILVVSTTGQGEFPQNARRCWKTLLSAALKPGSLRKLRFASFGLGDSSYPRYNVAHRMLHGRLLRLGAVEICERGEGNEQHPEGHIAGFRSWTTVLKAGLLHYFPLSPSEPALSDGTFLEPSWKLELAKLGEDSYPRIWGSQNAACADRDLVTADEPSDELLPVRGAHIAQVRSIERVTSPEHFQDVRLLDLRLNKPYEYFPGAVAVIYPKNFPSDVNAFIDLMGWHGIADSWLELKESRQGTAGPFRSPSPLRHLRTTHEAMTLRWLLENVFDIMAIPRRSFFANLAQFSAHGNADEVYQYERLLELADPQLIDELWDYTTRPKRTILEVMSDFTTVKIPWQYAFSVLPVMKGRQFSIASGGQLKLDDAGRTRVQLLIAIADPPSPIIKYKRRYGVCTRYVTTLKVGQNISIGMQAGYLNVQQKELEVPVLMIGPGTGVAPMRSMIYQRLAWAQLQRVQPGNHLNGDMLIFGCRAEQADYFFKDEWSTLMSTEGLYVITAFSRDATHQKQYVQDKIREESLRIPHMLLNLNAKVYVCGSSGNMPKGVRLALVEVLAHNGGGMSQGQAEAYVDQMEKEGRYKQETW